MYLQLLVYTVLIVLASILGGSVPMMVRLTHRRIQLTLSFVSGVMLGVAMFHLLPHSIQVLGNVQQVMGVALAGLLFMFFLIRIFHFHQHDLAVDEQHSFTKKELCDEQHDHHHVHCSKHSGKMDLTWIGLCFGLSIHTLIDGIALAAAIQSDQHGGYISLVAVGVFLAIVLHKPLDAMSITSLMAARNWNRNQQIVVNLVFSLMCPVGAILFVLGTGFVDTETRLWILGIALAFSGGIFLCISLGDLLPEVHFHAHDRLPLSAMLLLGVIIAIGIEFLPGHNHATPSKPVNNTSNSISDAESPLVLRPISGSE